MPRRALFLLYLNQQVPAFQQDSQLSGHFVGVVATYRHLKDDIISQRFPAAVLALRCQQQHHVVTAEAVLETVLQAIQLAAISGLQP